MADAFEGDEPGLTAPLTRVERSTHTVADFTLAFTSRSIHVSADGTLVVWTPDSPTSRPHTVSVTQGWNPIRITKIVKVGSSAITVDCWD